jgi:hypothetical protein
VEQGRRAVEDGWWVVETEQCPGLAAGVVDLLNDGAAGEGANAGVLSGVVEPAGEVVDDGVGNAVDGVVGQHPVGLVVWAHDWLACPFGGKSIDSLTKREALPVETDQPLSDPAVRYPGVGEVGEETRAVFQDL